MEIPKINAWSVLGKLVAYGAVALLAYRAVYPERDPTPRPPRPIHAVPIAPVVQPHPPKPADSSGWDWEATDEVSQYGETQADGLPINQGILMTNVLLGPGRKPGPIGDVPEAIVDALMAEVVSPENRAFLAAICWQETRYNDLAIRKEAGDDNGHAFGPFQIHDKWGEGAAQAAESAGRHELAEDIRAGITEDVRLNLRGVRAFMAMQKQWRKPGGYHSIASYYNEGSKQHRAKGQRYANRVMAKYEELLPEFKNITY